MKYFVVLFFVFAWVPTAFAQTDGFFGISPTEDGVPTEGGSEFSLIRILDTDTPADSDVEVVSEIVTSDSSIIEDVVGFTYDSSAEAFVALLEFSGGTSIATISPAVTEEGSLTATPVSISGIADSDLGGDFLTLDKDPDGGIVGLYLKGGVLSKYTINTSTGVATKDCDLTSKVTDASWSSNASTRQLRVKTNTTNKYYTVVQTNAGCSITEVTTNKTLDTTPKDLTNCPNANDASAAYDVTITNAGFTKFSTISSNTGTVTDKGAPITKPIEKLVCLDPEVEDLEDFCPTDADKTVPGTCGCGVADIDTDGDGTLDCNDSCVNDPDKTAPGVCGCGTSDVDTDSDGTFDCNDGCVNDADKTSAGQCGCGTADIDSDGDGIASCIDACPTDANKSNAGTCGCGTADVDANADGVIDCIASCKTNNSDPDCDRDGFPKPEDPDNPKEGEDPDDSEPEVKPEELLEEACAGYNTFFRNPVLEKSNIASVINNSDSDIFFSVFARGEDGQVRGQASFTLASHAKQDVLVDELDAVDDRYGNFCVQTNASEAGDWYGYMAVTKYNGSEFQFRRLIPLKTASNRQKFVVPLNTHPIFGEGTVAIWGRFIDADPEDGSLELNVKVYGSDQELLKNIDHSITPGARWDEPFHEHLGYDNHGIAVITNNSSSTMYFEVSRYMYDGFATELNPEMFSATSINFQPLQGSTVSGLLSRNSEEVNVLEKVNGLPVDVSASFGVFDTSGDGSTSNVTIPSNGTFHSVIPSDGGSTSLGSSLPASLSGMTMVYNLGSKYVYSSPSVRPAGDQILDYNSFLAHTNEVEVMNAGEEEVSISIEINDIEGNLIQTLAYTLAAKETRKDDITSLVAANSYGTVIVRDESNTRDIIARMLTTLAGQYTNVIVGRKME